ncbi:MAG: hypothetical protein JOY99_09690 [Sphingomonadaceae bacterium]|nr:hypothetical protein [Sphingomonadaceae bacterium]
MRVKQALIAVGLGAGIAALGAGPSAAQKLKPEQEARIQPTGKPEDCVQINRIQETRVRDDQTIDFYMIDNHVYRNRLPQSCPTLGTERRFSYTTSLPELCSTDTITVFFESPLMRGATCGLGQFQPVSGAPR